MSSYMVSNAREQNKTKTRQKEKVSHGKCKVSRGKCTASWAAVKLHNNLSFGSRFLTCTLSTPVASLSKLKKHISYFVSITQPEEEK